MLFFEQVCGKSLKFFLSFRNVSVVDVCHCKQVRYLVSDVGELVFFLR